MEERVLDRSTWHGRRTGSRDSASSPSLGPRGTRATPRADRVVLRRVGRGAELRMAIPTRDRRSRRGCSTSRGSWCVGACADLPVCLFSPILAPFTAGAWNTGAGEWSKAWRKIYGDPLGNSPNNVLTPVC
jgi:hypothetical protein